jgi:hypothetical protein
LDAKLSPESGKVVFSTRSGNTSKPDKVWSEWSEIDKQNQIKSPVARYIQYKAVFESRKESPGPSVDSIALYYQVGNQPPRIARISVLPANIELTKSPRAEMPLPPVSSSFGPAGQSRSVKPAGSDAIEDAFAVMARAPVYQQVKKLGFRSVTWQATDPNGDELSYDTFHRSAGSDKWKPLRQGIKDTFVSWDAATWPDGEYYIRVVASDTASNQEGEARIDEIITESFSVDNTAPTIQIDASDEMVRIGSVPVTISDTTSIVDEAEFSMDGANWRPLLPIGGIYDSKSNKFKVPTEQLEKGDHYMVIRASDSSNNVSSQTIRFNK